MICHQQRGHYRRRKKKEKSQGLTFFLCFSLFQAWPGSCPTVGLGTGVFSTPRSCRSTSRSTSMDRAGRRGVPGLRYNDKADWIWHLPSCVLLYPQCHALCFDICFHEFICHQYLCFLISCILFQLSYVHPLTPRFRFCFPFFSLLRSVTVCPPSVTMHSPSDQPNNEN